ncbi:hypothetical protein V8D89_006647 [Ganoderma adspersum]
MAVPVSALSTTAFDGCPDTMRPWEVHFTSGNAQMLWGLSHFDLWPQIWDTYRGELRAGFKRRSSMKTILIVSGFFLELFSSALNRMASLASVPSSEAIWQPGIRLTDRTQLKMCALPQGAIALPDDGGGDFHRSVDLRSTRQSAYIQTLLPRKGRPATTRSREENEGWIRGTEDKHIARDSQTNPIPELVRQRDAKCIMVTGTVTFLMYKKSMR